MATEKTFQPAKQINATNKWGDSKRTYETPDGNKYPSVTSILGCVGKPALINWAAKQEREMVVEAAASLWEDVPTTGKKMSRVAYVATLTDRIGKTKAHQKELAKASEIGSQLHAMVEWNLRKELGQEVGPAPKLSDKASWSFMVYEDWRKKTKLTPKRIEQVVWSTHHEYAGTMDLLATIQLEPYGECVAVLDWKTGKAIYSEALLQNAAYCRALVEMGHLTEIPYGVIVRFPKVETDPEPDVRVITPTQHKNLFMTFLAVKALWEWQQEQDKERGVA